MAWIVNVENLEFEDLIPLLKKNIHIIEAVGYNYPPYKKQEGRVFNQLEILFNRLKKGKIAENFVIGAALGQCLDELGRLLIATDAYKHDFDIIPIKKEKLKNFLDVLSTTD